MPWIIVGGSVTGKGHLTEGADGQDAHCWRRIDESTVVTVVCDGAGSHSRSAEGAQLVSNWLCEDRRLDEWTRRAIDMSIEEQEKTWRDLASHLFSTARTNLEVHVSNRADLVLSDFSCTAILVLATETLVAVAHVGDGRACASCSEGSWFALFTPTRGAASNETVFLTSDMPMDGPYWEDAAQVFPGLIRGFALMSDGCEMGAFECWIPKESGQGFYDPNRPHAPFFEPILQTLNAMARECLSAELMEEKWLAFLDHGVPRFATESDDRTMILGALVP